MTTSSIQNAQAWLGPEMALRQDWQHDLTEAELAELRRALNVARASGRELQHIEVGHFPLDRLATKLAALRREALHGRGFFLLRGVPVESFSPWEAAAAFWGMGLYLGEAISQNGKGHVLGHVANLGLDYADPEVRGYQTSALLNYHTDFGDLVGLLCQRTPQSGGLSSIASSTTLWNTMLARRPDLAAALLEPVHYTRWGEVGVGQQRYYGMPVFQQCEGRMVVTYVRSAIRKAQLMPEVPPLSARQEEALDLLDQLAADPTIHLSMQFRPGDILLHSRTSYVDWPEPDRRRHLLRLWLACDDGPRLPANFTEVAQPATRSGRPAGIQVPGVPFSAPLDPC